MYFVNPLAMCSVTNSTEVNDCTSRVSNISNN